MRLIHTCTPQGTGGAPMSSNMLCSQMTGPSMGIGRNSEYCQIITTCYKLKSTNSQLPSCSWLGNFRHDPYDIDPLCFIIYVVHNTPPSRKLFDDKEELSWCDVIYGLNLKIHMEGAKSVSFVHLYCCIVSAERFGHCNCKMHLLLRLSRTVCRCHVATCVLFWR